LNGHLEHLLRRQLEDRLQWHLEDRLQWHLDDMLRWQDRLEHLLLKTHGRA
jgi:hypothetical protein